MKGEVMMYADYLNLLNVGNYEENEIRERLKYDILLRPEKKLYIPLSSSIKAETTNKILSDIDSEALWSNKLILLQIDKKYNSNPFAYFENRKNLLEENLAYSNYEYAAYSGNKIKDLFGTIIPRSGIDFREILIDREINTDIKFKKQTMDNIRKYYYDLEAVFPVERRYLVPAIYNEMGRLTYDTAFFSKDMAEIHISKCFKLRYSERFIFNRILDRSYIEANALSNFAEAFSLTKKITGTHLRNFIKSQCPALHYTITTLSWAQVNQLSLKDEWKDYTSLFIGLLVNNLEGQSDNLSELMRKVQRHTHWYKMCNFLFHFGKITNTPIVKDMEKEKLNRFVEYVSFLYTGAYRTQIDILNYIESSSKEVLMTINKIKKAHIIELGKRQKERNFK